MAATAVASSSTSVDCDGRGEEAQLADMSHEPAQPCWSRRIGSDTSTKPGAALLEWLAQQPGVDVTSAGLRIGRSRGRGRGVFAGADVEPGGLLGRVPSYLMMTVDTVSPEFAAELAAARSLCGSAVKDSDSEELPRLVRFWLYLIHARHRPDCRHHIMMQCWPLALDVPTFWSDEELEALRGSSAFAAATTARRCAFADYQQHVRPLTEADPVHFPKDIFTLRALLWARTMCTSRSFPRRFLGQPDSEPARDASDARAEAFVLCPLLDMFNHKPGASIVWHCVAETETGVEGGCGPAVEFRLEDTVADGVLAGKEIWNDFGPKSNEELLLFYGFCVPDCPHDRIVLSFVLRGGSAALERARAECSAALQRVARPWGEDRLVLGPFDVRRAPFGGAPPLLPELVRASLVCWGPEAARTQLISALRRLRARLPEPADATERPESATRLRLAQTYVQGQRLVLEQALRCVEDDAAWGDVVEELEETLQVKPAPPELRIRLIYSEAAEESDNDEVGDP